MKAGFGTLEAADLGELGLKEVGYAGMRLTICTLPNPPC